MNKKGNIMLNLLFFMMALAILIVFISPLKSFINMANGNDALNCKGYIDEDANGPLGSTYQNASYDSSKNTDNLSCLAIKLYLPYLFMVFLIAGVGKLLYDKGLDVISPQQQSGGY